MKPIHLLALALLVAASADLQAKGGRGRSHASSAHSTTSHAHAHAEASPGSALHAPVRAAGARGLGTGSAESAGSPGGPGSPTSQVADLSRLDAELAAQRQAARAASVGVPALQINGEPTPLPAAAPRARTAKSVSQAAVMPTSPTREADLSGLPMFRPSARPASFDLERDPGAHYNARGINCSAYPARCP